MDLIEISDTRDSIVLKDNSGFDNNTTMTDTDSNSIFSPKIREIVEDSNNVSLNSADSNMEEYCFNNDIDFKVFNQDISKKRKLKSVVTLEELEKAKKSRKLEDFSNLDEEIKSSHEYKSPKKIGEFMKYASRFQVGSKNDNPDIQFTHGFFGSYNQVSIPPKNDYEFKWKFFKATHPSNANQKENIPLCEHIGDFTKMFVDLDFKQKKPILLSELTQICSFIANYVNRKFFNQLFEKEDEEVADSPPKKNKELYDSESNMWIGCGMGKTNLSTMLSCSTEKLKSPPNSKGIRSFGIHMNWIGDIWVSPEQAIFIRNSIVYALIDKFGERDTKNGENTWDKVIDSNVYSSSGSYQGGMRVLYACKLDVCTECNGTGIPTEEQLKLNKQLKKCVECQGKKKMDIERFYKPYIILDHEGKKSKKLDWLVDQNNAFQALLASSIRTCLIEPCPYIDVPSEEIKKHKRKTNIIKDTMSQTPESNDRIDIKCEVVQQIMDIIRTRSEWIDLHPRVFKKMEKYYKLEVTSYSKTFCSIKGDEHSHQNIWFAVYPNSIYQKCFNDSCKQKRITEPVFYGLPCNIKTQLFQTEFEKEKQKCIERDTSEKWIKQIKEQAVKAGKEFPKDFKFNKYLISNLNHDTMDKKQWIEKFK